MQLIARAAIRRPHILRKFRDDSSSSSVVIGRQMTVNRSDMKKGRQLHSWLCHAGESPLPLWPMSRSTAFEYILFDTFAVKGAFDSPYKQFLSNTPQEANQRIESRRFWRPSYWPITAHPLFIISFVKNECNIPEIMCEYHILLLVLSSTFYKSTALKDLYPIYVLR